MRAALLLALAAGLAPVAAFAAPPKLPGGPGEIRLVEMSGQTRERELVEAFVPEAKDQPLETLLYDLNGDGNPEVVARLRGKGMCDEANRACRTLAFRKEAKGWTLIFDRPSQRLDSRGSGYGGMRDLIVDGRETYGFTANGYKLDFAASGKVVEMKPAPAGFVSALATQFGLGAERLALKGKGLAFKVATVEPKAGSPLVLARMEGPGACGRVLGCPWRLLRVKDGKYAVGFAGEKVALLPVTRDGWRDIAVASTGGFTVYGWSGQRYMVAETRKEGSVR